jgi:prevent-host-death family protein
MRTITIHQAKTHLSRFLKEVEGGETLIVARGNKPVARIVPFSADERRFDGLTDVVVRIDESFSNPLDDFAPYMVAEDPS